MPDGDAMGPAVRVAAMALTAYFIAFLVFAILTDHVKALPDSP